MGMKKTNKGVKMDIRDCFEIARKKAEIAKHEIELAEKERSIMRANREAEFEPKEVGRPMKNKPAIQVLTGSKGIKRKKPQPAKSKRKRVKVQANNLFSYFKKA